MTYRTVVVHLGFDGLSKARLELAVRFAHAHTANLVGCYAATWADVWFRRGEIGTLAQASAALNEHARQAEVDFNTVCAAKGLRGSFARKDKRKLDSLIDASLLADVCVLSNAEPVAPDEGYPFESIPESLLMAASCPVLLLPEKPVESVGRRVLVAWKPRREASRAVRDALPVLRQAARVTVLTIGSATEDWRTHDIRPFLAAHGVKAELMQNPSSDANAGEVILKQAELAECDSIVMGAYGHSRVREFVLGGATRHVLRHAKIPLIMSH